MARQFFVGGNFKMNGTVQSVKEIVNNLNNAKLDGKTQVVVAPTAAHLMLVRENLRKDIAVAAQNMYWQKNGAFTGELSADILKDIGVTWTLLGHSERRVNMEEIAESNKFLAKKTEEALEQGINVIFCCGEPAAIRFIYAEKRDKDGNIVIDENGQAVMEIVGEKEQDALDYVQQQLEETKGAIKDWTNVVIAYEPIWAIGTGKSASNEQAQKIHAHIRGWLKTAVSPQVAESTRIIYGGSVNEKNAGALATQPDIDGFLVGGASLKPAFVDIVNANSA